MSDEERVIDGIPSEEELQRAMDRFKLIGERAYFCDWLLAQPKLRLASEVREEGNANQAAAIENLLKALAEERERAAGLVEKVREALCYADAFVCRLGDGKISVERIDKNPIKQENIDQIVSGLAQSIGPALEALAAYKAKGGV